MDRIRINREEGEFFMIYNGAFRDGNLSLKARGLLATIMSLPSNWDFSIGGLSSILKEGRTAIYTAIDELIEQGYCVRTSIRDNGKIMGNDYQFAEKKGILATSAPYSENPNTENLNLENQPQYNIQDKIISNKDNNIGKKETIESKREKFRLACEKYKSQYGEKLVNDFVFYWSEANGNRLRCEIARNKTGCFEIGRRIATWASKPYNNNNGGYAPAPAPVPQKPKKTKWEEMGLTEEEYNKFIKG